MKFNHRLASPLFLIALVLASPSLFAGSATQSSESYDHYLRALMFEAQGNFVSAAEELDKALKSAPDSAYLHRTRAELSLRLGQVNVASEEIETAVNLDPSDVKALILAGQIHWALGNVEKAEEKLKRAVALAPDEAEALVSLAGTLIPRNPKEAENLYKEFLVRHPGEISILERLAQLYQNMSDTISAQKTWEKILSLAPGYDRAHLALAQFAEINFDTATAVSHYEAVMTEDPSNLPLLLRVGELQYRNNEMAKAYEAFSRAQAIAPESSAANFWLALLSEQRGDWNEAIRLLGQVASLGVEPGVHLRLSYYYSQVGRFKDAVRVLKELSDTQPDNTDFLKYLAIAREQSKMIRLAEKTHKRIIELAPLDPEAHFHLATFYDRMGKFTKSEPELRKAISLKPDYHIALNYLGYSLADRDIKLEEAERLLRDAIGLDPENPAYMDSLGWLYYRQGKLQKATDFLREATLRVRDPVIWDHLGSVESAKGEYMQAILSWDESLRYDPSYRDALKKSSTLFRKLSRAQKVQLFVKRASTHFGDLQTVKGLIRVTVCESKPCFGSKAQLAYHRDEELIVEIPGPLTGPVMQLRKKHGFPAQYGALHPQFQMVEYYITKAFERIASVLSGNAFRLVVLGEFSKTVVEKPGGIRAEDGIVAIQFKGDPGFVRELEWIGKAGGDELELGPYQIFGKDRENDVPTKMEWRDKETGFRIQIEFLNPTVSRFSQGSKEEKTE